MTSTSTQSELSIMSMFDEMEHVSGNLHITKKMFTAETSTLTSEIGPTACCGQRLIRINNNRRTHDFVFSISHGKMLVNVLNNASKGVTYRFASYEQFKTFIELLTMTIGKNKVYEECFRARTSSGEPKNHDYYETSDKLGATYSHDEVAQIITAVLSK